MKNLKNTTPAEKVLIVKKWVKPLLIVSSLVFVLWFFFAVFQEKNGGATTERIGGAGETSKRLRTEVRTWLRKTFPVSAARAAEQFGFFEMERNELPVSRTEWVILAHGLDEPGNLWADLGPALAEMGFRVFEFRYPNDQPIHESSRFLHEQFEVLLNSFDSEKPPDGLHLIGHSMGGLVFRDFITHPDLLPICLWTDQTPVLKLIHAGTPNHGSWLSTYRFPAELRDHLFKDYGMDAFLGMLWDGAGEAQIDLQPESAFLTELNGRPFPKDIYWVGIAGTGSPVDLLNIQNNSKLSQTSLGQSVGKLQKTFPELFKGTGDGVVSTDSLHCAEMNAVYYVEANHRNMVRDPSGTPPAIEIIKDVLSRK